MRRSAAAVTGVVLGVVGLLLAILFSLGQEPAGGVEAGRTAIEPAGSGLIPSATANVELVGQFDQFILPGSTSGQIQLDFRDLFFYLGQDFKQ